MESSEREEDMLEVPNSDGRRQVLVIVLSCENKAIVLVVIHY